PIDDTNDSGNTNDTGDSNDTGDTNTTDTDDTGGGPGFNCTSDYNTEFGTPDPGTNQQCGECVTDEILCGDVIFASTEGGSTYYDDSWGSDSDRGWADVMACPGRDGVDAQY